MGIHGLWETIHCASEARSLASMTLGHEYTILPGVPQFRLGIDASIWFKQCSKAFLTHHAEMGKNPELRTLFFRFARLHANMALVDFVLDGPARPERKRDTRVIAKPLWLVDDACELVESFGFNYHIAPGEAEAELGAMNNAGHIHAILTDDGDTFMFGAHTVIRSLDAKHDSDEIQLYTSEAILAQVDAKMNRNGMVLMALLSGGDYDTNGLAQCGPRTALGLVRYGIGDTLCNGIRIYEDQELEEFLATWRNILRSYLRFDPLMLIGRRNAALADAVTDQFPNVNVLRAYVFPAISIFDRTRMRPFNEPHRLPNLHQLALFCRRNFAWTDSTIINKFRSLVWPGYILGLIRNELIIASANNNIGILSPKPTYLGKRPVIQRQRVYHGIKQYKIYVPILRLVHMTLEPSQKACSTAHSERSKTDHKDTLTEGSLLIWVPASMYMHWQPDKLWESILTPDESLEEDGRALATPSVAKPLATADAKLSGFPVSVVTHMAEPSRTVIDLTMSPEHATSSSALLDCIDLTMISD